MEMAAWPCTKSFVINVPSVSSVIRNESRRLEMFATAMVDGAPKDCDDDDDDDDDDAELFVPISVASLFNGSATSVTCR